MADEKEVRADTSSKPPVPVGISDTPATIPANDASALPERENFAPLRSFAVPPPPSEHGLSGDIAQILEEVKLPERRTPSAGKPIENKATIFDTLSGAPRATTEPTDAANASPAIPVMSRDAQSSAGAAVQTEDDSLSPVASVHTLKDDLQAVVREQKMSLVRAVSLEEERRAREKQQTENADMPVHAEGHYARTILLSAALLAFVGAGALFFVYDSILGRAAAPPVVQNGSLLFAENSVSFSIDGQTPTSLKQSLATALETSQGALGSITQLIPTTSTTTPGGTTRTRPATFAEFMQAIGAHPPDELVRALSNTFFFGVHSVDTNVPVLVIPVTSYDHAFAGMLAWEPTMNADLAPIYAAVPATRLNQNGLPTSRTFQDLTIRNYDVRALEDDHGTVKLYYSFPSQQILIIAQSPYSFSEVLSRLQAAREL